MRDRAYAVRRVERLKVKLATLEALPVTSFFKNRPVQKQIDSTKGALRRWLREYDIDDELLKSITRI